MAKAPPVFAPYGTKCAHMLSGSLILLSPVRGIDDSRNGFRGQGGTDGQTAGAVHAAARNRAVLRMEHHVLAVKDTASKLCRQNSQVQICMTIKLLQIVRHPVGRLTLNLAGTRNQPLLVSRSQLLLSRSSISCVVWVSLCSGTSPCDFALVRRACCLHCGSCAETVW